MDGLVLEVVSASDHRGKLGRLSLGNQDLQVQDRIHAVQVAVTDSLKALGSQLGW